MRKQHNKLKIVKELIICFACFCIIYFGTIEPSSDNGNFLAVDNIDSFSEEISLLSMNDDLHSGSEYATKRLIVLSDTFEFDTYGASAVSYDNLFILSYETEGACKKAYKHLIEDNSIVSVEIDSIMETEENDNPKEETDVVTNETKDTELKQYLDELTPTKEITVAILDTGVDKSIFDSNRVIDLGINLSSTGEENSITDDNGHGTEMASIIADNSNDYVKIMPIKVANSDGKATVLNTYLGIQKAIENGANIINISMNTYKSASSQILTDIIDEATAKGIIVVVSAGNNSTDTENIIPANIDSAIVVSAVNSDMSFADYSNHGVTVDYCSYGTYGDKTGTSYAAANVAGIIAEALSKNQDISILEQYVIGLGDKGKDSLYGNGFIGYQYQSSQKEDYNEYDECETDVGKNLNIKAETLYVALGDTNFDITSDFRSLTYNSDYYDIEYIDCTPEFDIHTENNYSATYRFINKEDEEKSTTLSRTIEVIDNAKLVEDIYSLSTSATTVAKTGSGKRYTAYSRLEDYPSREFDSSKNLSPSNARAYLALSSLMTCATKVKDNTTTWDKIINYGKAVYKGTTLPAKPSGVSKLQCTIAFEMTQLYVSGCGVATRSLTYNYLSSVRTAVVNMNKAGVEASSAYNAADYTDAYKQYFTSEKMYWTFYDAYESFIEVLRYSILLGEGTGYGHTYAGAPKQSDYSNYSDYVKAVKEDTEAGGSVNFVPLVQNIYLYEGDTISFKMKGKSCSHVGVYGDVYRSEAYSSQVAYDVGNQSIHMGQLEMYNTSETDSETVSYTATKDGYYTFDGTGTAYACKYAEIYITTTSSYTIYSTTYTITYNLDGGTVSGNPTTYTKQSETFTLNNPTKTGYTFAGWTGSNGTTKQTSVSITKGSSGNRTYTANWNINSYLQTVYVRYQNADGTWGAYSAVINTNYNYGSTVSWSRAADATYQAASLTSYTVTGANTKYVDVYRNTHTVTLSKGTGVASVSGAGTYYYGQSATINASLQTGYHFVNWTGSATYSDISNTITVDGDKTFTANAALNTYTLTINPNGGTMYYNSSTTTTMSSFNVKFQYGSNRHLGTFTGNYFGYDSTVGKPSRKGYTFTGWKVTSGGGTVNYYPTQDALGYKTDDFTELMNRPNTYAYYLFDGNYAGNVTITAQWTPNTYTLTVNPNGGKMYYNDENTTTSSFNIKFQYGSNRHLGTFTGNYYGYNSTVGKPIRTGYTFDDWKVTSGGGNVNYYYSTPDAYGYKTDDFTQMMNRPNSWGYYLFDGNYAGNVTITAQWTPNPNTKYVVNHYQMNLDGFTYTLKDTENKTGTTATTIIIANLKKSYTGFTYQGGKGTTAASATKPSSFDATTTILADGTRVINLYYSRNLYTVTLNKGTGIASVSGAGTYYYGQSATINAELLTGYKWVNWTGSVTYSSMSSSFIVNGDKTFTANARPITYKIRFNGNGNWNTAQGSYTQNYTYDMNIALTDNKFSRADATTYRGIYYERGYEFIGWGTSPTQTTATYSNKQTVRNLTTTDNATIDLYALWKKDITLTIDFNGGKFNNSGTSKVLRYTMYNFELNHTFDITQYYGTLIGNDYNSKGLNSNLTKTDASGIQYRFLGYSLNPDATVPDTNFDIYSSTRTENYTIRDNTTLYAVWEPVLQMTVQVSAPSHPGTIVLTDDVSVNTALGNFKILSGTKNTDLLSGGTATVNSATIGANVTNEDSVSYTVTAKGASSIKFGTAADSRILDIYNHGKNNPWFDNLNEVKDFNYSINDFTSATSSFTIPQYLGTTQSYQTSNPDLASGTAVYGIKFTCTQPSYYYKKYWNSDESTSVYCILFLKATNPDSGNGLPPYAVEDGMYNFQTILD